MQYTLTTWWELLDNETRKLAKKYEDINYPDALTTPYTSVDINENMDPWNAIHKMASLGAAIENNVMYGAGIATKIDTAGKKLGEPLPNSTRYIPAITDERSLLLALVYYRSQCRFKDIQSSNGTVQNGMFGIPGLEKNKPTVAKESEILKKKIKNFCSAHQDIATQAHEIFQELFTEDNAVGSDLFKAKSLSEQYTDFAGGLITDLLEDIQIDSSSHDELQKKILMTTNDINEKLLSIKREIEILYLNKKMKEFVDDVKKPAEMTLHKFMENLDNDGNITQERTNKAKEIWEAAEQNANNQKSVSENITEGVNYLVNNYIPGVFQNMLYFRYNPVAYFPQIVGVDEPARLKRFKEHFNSNLTNNITNQSQALNRLTGMKTEDLNTASSQDIQNLSKVNMKLSIEISSLKKSLKSYKEEVGKDSIIKFSKASFFGWITKKLAQFEFTKSLLHDNIHYLKIAKDFEKDLEKLEEEHSLDEDTLSTIKGTMLKKITDVEEGSRYLLFKKDRKKAHQQLANIISGYTR